MTSSRSLPLFVLSGLLACLSALGAADEVLRSDRPPPWVKPYLTNRLADPPPPGAASDVHYLLADRQTHAEKETRFYHYSYRLLTEAGVQDNSQLSIPFDPKYETVTLHSLSITRQGKVINKLDTQEVKILQRESGAERQIYDGRLTAMILMEDIRVGDVVEYAYSITGANPVFDGHFSHVESTRWSAPVHQSRVRVLWAADRPVKYRNQDSPVEPQFFTQGGLMIAQLEEEDLPAILNEGDLPENFFCHPWIEFSDFPDWQSVARWAAAQFPQDQALPEEARVEVDRLRQLKTEEERILGALRWVQDSIRYVGLFQGIHSHRPFPLESVVGRRFGDCKDKSNLLTTMLRALGFQCRIGLVSTRNRSAIHQWIPSPDTFDHAVVGIDTANGLRWMDATASYQRGSLADLHFPDYGWVLPVDPATTELLRVTPSGLDKSEVKTAETFVMSDYKGSARLSVVTQYWGSQADSQRSYFASRSRDEIERAYLNHYARDYPKIKVLEALKSEDDEAENVFTTRESYALEEVWKPTEADPSKLQFALGASIVSDELFLPSTRVRTMPFFLPHPRLCTQVLEVHFPSPLQLNNATEHITNPAFHFSVKEVSTPKVATITYRYQSRQNRVTVEQADRYMKDVQKALNQVGYTFTVPADYATQGPEALAVAETEVKAGYRPVWTLILVSIMSLLAGTLVCVVLYFWDPAAKPRLLTGGPVLEGLGGWLILIGFGVVVRAPTSVWAAFTNLRDIDAETWNALTREGSAAYHALWEPVLILDMAVLAAMVPFYSLLLILFFKRRTSLPPFLAGLFVWTAVYSALVIYFYGQIPSLQPEDIDEASKDLTRAIVTVVIWVPYLFVSKRVQNTFTRRRVAPKPPPLPSGPANPSFPPAPALGPPPLSE